MKMMFKRILAVFLCVLMLCGAVPFGAFAAQDIPAKTAIETESFDATGGEADPSAELPERFDLVRYRRFLVVPPDSRLTFHTTAYAPEGYYISWSVDDYGSECVFDGDAGQRYNVSADLVRQSDGAVVKTTRTETVYVLKSALAQWLADRFLTWYAAWYFTFHISGGLPVYFFFDYNDNRIGVDHYVGFWD